jgi:hypothetical protein
MIKYYVRTLYRLPPSKWILDDLESVPTILEGMMAKKPAHRRMTRETLLDSVAIITIDTERLPCWKDIFKEFTDWDWIDLEASQK